MEGKKKKPMASEKRGNSKQQKLETSEKVKLRLRITETACIQKRREEISENGSGDTDRKSCVLGFACPLCSLNEALSLSAPVLSQSRTRNSGKADETMQD
ncbi:hypothetical protein K1719_031083 [Acacia pycnantha]|nr:hypothetical protein K1719_031083 [Acacia pycnantha]